MTSGSERERQGEHPDKVMHFHMFSLFIQRMRIQASLMNFSALFRHCLVPGPDRDYPESGPSFGADSLVIPLASGNPKVARSKLGSYYER